MLDSATAVVGLIVGLIAIGTAVGGAIAWWRRRRAKGEDGMAEPVRPEQPRGPEPGAEAAVGEVRIRVEVSISGLSARAMLRADDFKDREKDLARLGQLMAEGRGVIWVTGPAQAGKSWLVSRYVRDNGLGERAARFELRGGADVQGLFEGVNAFLRQRGENGFDVACRSVDLDVAGKAAALVHVLNRERWVLVLDSFEDVMDDVEWAQIVKIMQDDLEKSVVVIGSRLMPEWGDAKAEVALGPIEEKAGKELLEEAGAPEAALGELYEAVGGVPGALEHAGALARRRTASEVARDARKAAGQVGEVLLADTFEEASEGARRLWAGLCLLPAPVTRDAAREMCEREDFDASWDELVGWKLLEPGEEKAELHPLARAIGEGRLSQIGEWEEECAKRIARFYARFAEEKGEDRAAVEGELENVLAAARLAFRYGEWEALWAMGGALGERLEWYGRWGAQRELFTVCIEGARSAKERKREAQFVHNLGIAMQNQGKLEEAEGLYNQSVEIEKELGNRVGVAQSLHHLGMVAEDRGKLEEAEGLYKQSLEIEREVGDRPGEAQTLHNLGAIAQARGKLEEAEGLYEQSLEIEREVGSQPGIAQSLHQLGMVAQDRGKLDEAEGYYGQSVEIAREVGDRPGEARTLHQLGIVSQTRGTLEEAEGLYEQSLEIKREVGDRPGEARTLHQLGTVAEMRGKLEEAEGLYKQSLEIKREVGDRPGEAKTLAQMALLAEEQGDLGLAEEQGDLGLAVERMGRAVAMFEEMGLAEAERARGELGRLRRRLEEEAGGSG
jgi:tetratricopeptide (TPR) repeat protein